MICTCTEYVYTVYNMRTSISYISLSTLCSISKFCSPLLPHKLIIDVKNKMNCHGCGLYFCYIDVATSYIKCVNIYIHLPTSSCHKIKEKKIIIIIFLQEEKELFPYHLSLFDSYDTDPILVFQVCDRIKWLMINKITSSTK